MAVDRVAELPGGPFAGQVVARERWRAFGVLVEEFEDLALEGSVSAAHGPKSKCYVMLRLFHMLGALRAFCPGPRARLRRITKRPALHAEETGIKLCP